MVASRTVLPARPLAFERVPVVDIAPLVRGESADDVVAELAHACEHVGFVYLAGHGCSPARLAALRDAATALFDLPLAERMAVRVNHRMRGYLPLDYTSYEGEDREGRSHQQGFWMGVERPETAASPLDGPNLWPQSLPALRTAMTDWMVETRALAVVIRRALARALGLPADALDAFFDGELSRLKLNHYPSRRATATETHLGVVPHTDSGAFTLLWQDESGGLEVQNTDGRWVGAPPVDGTLVLNLGAIMALWTNGRFPATTHRVVHAGSAARQSMPLFVNPGPQAVIAPLLPGAATAQAPFRYGDYQLGLWRRTFPVAYSPA